MRKPVLTIFYQFNPWNATIGGIQTLINTFIKYAPNEFELRLVGTGNDQNQPLGRWQKTEFAGREISFLPLFILENDNVRKLIPTTVKYTAALMGRCLASDFMHFHRLEPSLAAFNWQGEKTLFIHNDIRTQIQTGSNKKAILWRRFPAAYFALENLLVRQFSQILSCNTDSAQFYKQRYPSMQDRIAYIKNSFDNEVFYPLSREEREAKRRELASQLLLAEETRFVLFAGRLHPQKDPILLVRAIAALNDPSIHLLIAGDGELAGEVRAEIGRLGLSDRVTMLGAIAQAELAPLHRISSAFVLSSVYEGLPLVALEALASGTPVVTTQSGETPKLLLSGSGIVCGERTPTSLADALRKILQHPDDYPIDSCVQSAKPYAASNVIRDVYNAMLHRWEKKGVRA
ncbi:glycosyltransferase [Aetokthonos hydrillicola Thurmond2011]|jgi:glycosyltransferase involved in cell wall biosynthesis|uniref:Glycosyltransferase n=2 Tax=Aetokthonos TaxID=1550243 RepID=A0AAP5M8H0_9CYAN|nr:glycosyltransferase [Aetokthonos hydrillicola]MBO3460923.1 glycosyltransferase family 4 protein [Aetokthonos hydrillicola CCALA 1050]MBW4586472.1 glycosyltransferase [Aetokthonos hydrillicola CCALA 1050]MDR9893583.1 glycosyltransferase [Aetokthonos hydrillicola Thurmond2011]